MPSTRSRSKGSASAVDSSRDKVPSSAIKRRTKPAPTPSSSSAAAAKPAASPPPPPSKTKKTPAATTKSNKCRKDNTPFLPLFLIIAAARLFAALTNIIHDCDEVYNYWEPLHFALFGSGMQTWEYSSAFALRPWLYLALHGAVAAPAAALSRMILGLGFGDSKKVAFYAVRVALALLSAAAEASLAAAAGDVLGGRKKTKEIRKKPSSPSSSSSSSRRLPLVSVVLALLLATSAGMFSSAPALLPSSFVMVFLTLAAAQVLRGDKPIAVIACGVFGLLWGWPVAGVAFLPFALWVLSFCGGGGISSVLTIAGSASALTLLAVAPLVALDRVAYGKWTLSLLNFLKYNVSGEGGDSSLYGVEEWHYYLRNSALNLGLVAVLAVAAPAVLAVAALGQRVKKGRGGGGGGGNENAAADDDGGEEETPSSSSISLSPSSLKRLALASLPLPLWSAVLSALPHKEERFLYPVYPLACLAAAAAVAAAPAAAVAAVVSLPLAALGKLRTVFSTTPPSPSPSSSASGRGRGARTRSSSSSSAAKSSSSSSSSFSSSRFYPSFALLLQASLVAAAAAVGCSRIAALLASYSAPLRIYSHLPKDPVVVASSSSNNKSSSNRRSLVCLGAEWHRFPSSFLLPGENYRLAFVASGFGGLLPTPFVSPKEESGARGTRAAPPSLNDRNRRDERNELANDAPCDWFVGLAPPLGDAGREPHGNEWDRVASLPFLDVNADNVRALPALARAFYLPRWFAERVVRKPSWAAAASAEGEGEQNGEQQNGGGGGLLSRRGQYVLMRRKKGVKRGAARIASNSAFASE